MTKPIHSPLGYGAAALMALSGSAFAAGFQVVERSVSGLGRAYSGEAAIVDNASAIGSNAAAAAYYDSLSLSAGLHVIFPEFDVTGTINGVLPANGEDISETIYVPSLYVAGPLSERVGWGLGITAPYGLVTDYPSDFAGTFIADESDLTTVSINPNLAFRINDNLTIGAGISVVHADATLTSTSQGARVIDIRGNTTDLGWNVGAMLDLTDQTRLGIAYRGAVAMSLEGDIISDVAAPLNGPGTADLELPPTFEISLNHDFCSSFSVHADAMWTGWSTFQELAPVLNNGIPVPPTPEKWNDVWRFAVGATYVYSDKLTFRLGLALDESPVEPEYRTLRIPDEDRMWASIGATYQINEQLSADLGYTHIFLDEAAVTEESEAGVFDGEIEGGISIVGVQLNYTF